MSGTGQRTRGLAAKMAARLRRGGYRSRYRLRKVVVERERSSPPRTASAC